MHAGKNSLPAVSKDVFMTTSDKQNPFGCLRLAARSDMFKTKRAAHDKAMPTNGIFHNGTTSDKQILSDVCGLLPEALYLRQNALLMWRPISRTFAVESVWFLTTSHHPTSCGSNGIFRVICALPANTRRTTPG